MRVKDSSFTLSWKKLIFSRWVADKQAAETRDAFLDFFVGAPISRQNLWLALQTCKVVGNWYYHWSLINNKKRGQF